jgi:outer membrane biogenesis lipoprotein LolB
MMNNVKKVFVLLLIAAVVSLGLTGCKKKASEPPADEQPTSEHPAEHPTEHPK